MHMCKQVSKEARDAKTPGAGVIGSCEAPDMGAGTQTLLHYQERYQYAL